MWQCFRWMPAYQPVDHVAGPRGLGSEILLGELSSDAPAVWAGRILLYDELSATLRPAAPAPPPVRSVDSEAAAPAPAVVHAPHRRGILGSLAMFAAAVAMLGASLPLSTIETARLRPSPNYGWTARLRIRSHAWRFRPKPAAFNSTPISPLASFSIRFDI